MLAGHWTEAHRSSNSAEAAIAIMMPRLDGLYVLFVDDNEDAREIARIGLEHQGAFVHVAPSVPEAFVMMSTVRPDVIITDIAMPPLDGYEFLSELKQSAAWRDIPVIAVTGHGDIHDERTVRTAGFAEYLPKPIDPSAMAAAIARVLPPAEN
jgi:diguanylate cyclase